MDFIAAILLYILLLLMLLTVTWRIGIPVFSAVTVSFLLAGIFLIILIPPTEIDRYVNDMIDGYHHKNKHNSTAVNIVCAIYLVTLVIIMWYVLVKAYEDRNPCIDFDNLHSI